MNEQDNERYIRRDTQGGFLYNKSDINYYKQVQNLDVIRNLLLGDFNGKGNYVLSKGIIDELVSMKKVYQYSFGATTFCQSMNDVGEFGKLNFAIKIRNNAQNGTVTATLQLLETIDRANGYYQNTNTVSIENYTANESNSFVVDMLKYYNVISKKEEGFLKRDQKAEDVDMIISRKRFENMLKAGSNEKIDLINKALYEKRLKLLGKSAIGKTILEELNKETYKINGWFVKEGVSGYYLYLNQILDSLFERHNSEILQDVALTAGWRKINDNFATELNNIFESLSKTVQKTAEASNNAELINQLNQTKENKSEVAKSNSEVQQKQEEKPKVAQQTQKVEQKTEQKSVEKNTKQPAKQPNKVDALKTEQKQQPNKVDEDLMKAFNNVSEEESKKIVNTANNSENFDLMGDNESSKMIKNVNSNDDIKTSDQESKEMVDKEINIENMM